MTRGTDLKSQKIQTSRDCPGFVSLPFCYLLLRIFDDVLDIRHFVFCFYDVLDLFLGLHRTLSRTMD